MALGIIGAGFGRTGTNSLKLALERLGFGPCHHMFEIRDDPSLLPAWEAVGNGADPDFDALFAGYRAQVDWPGARYWREMAARWPDAKVILTVRDPGAWHESASRTIIPFVEQTGAHPTEHMNRIGEMARKVVVEPVFGGRMNDRDHAIAMFERHAAEVQAALPAERLLVYRVEEGWAPLCAFLGAGIPDEPFPHTNSSRDFSEKEWS